MKWFKTTIEKFGQFSGRSRRKEFWMFFLLVAIIGAICYILDRFVLKWELSLWGQGLLESIFALFILLPFLAILVRRLHDVGKKWTWLFIALVPIAGQIMIIYLLSKKGQVGRNKFGKDPKRIKRKQVGNRLAS